MNQFMPGLELNRLFYSEVIQPLLAARFPDVVYSAGLIGYGSDVLGYDTAISTDHEWGPRLLIFLRRDSEQKHRLQASVRGQFCLLRHFARRVIASQFDNEGTASG